MMAFLWGLWAMWRTAILKWLIYIGAAVAFVGTIWLKGYSASNRKWRQRQRDAKMRQLESKAKINAETNSMADERLNADLSRWMRD